MSRPKVDYAIVRADSGEVLGRHRTRQAAIDTWRLVYTGIPVRIWRLGRGSEADGVLIVEGTWQEAQRPDGR